MRNMLVIVDMVNGFVKEGALADKGIERTIPFIIEKIKKAKQNNDLIIAFRDCHDEDDVEFLSYPKHCIKGSYESQLIDELKPYENDMVIIDKNTTNGFNTPQMAKILNSKVFDSIEITGCCSDICVSDLAGSLAKHFAKNKISTQIYVDENCIDTFNAPKHNADEINKDVIDNFEKIGINVTRKGQKSKHTLTKVKKLTNGKFLNLYEATFENENGEKRYEIVSRKDIPEFIKPSLKVDAVNIVPYQYVDGKVIVYLIKEFRYPINDYIYGVPSGLIDENENAEESVKRELKEEIGADVISIKHSDTSAYTTAGMADESIDFYQALVEINDKQHLEGSEDITVMPVDLEQLEVLLNSKKFGAQGKLQLRIFLEQQKIKALEQKIAELEGKER